MTTTQDVLFQYISHEPGSTGVVILAVGVVYGFYGFRLFVPLLGVTWAALGAVGGLLLGGATGLPMVLTGTGLAAICALVAISARKVGAAGACAATWGLLGWYLADQMGGEPLWRIACGGSGALLGGLFALLCYRTMTVLLTTMQGAALIVVGFIGAASAFVPTFGGTFVDMARRFGVLGPIMLLVVAVTAYSYQALQRQGDVRMQG